MTEIIATENKDWGFWGTAQRILQTEKQTLTAWNEISEVIQNLAGLTPRQTQKLLDSRWGRHMADSYYEELQNGTFIEAFKAKETKATLLKNYDYYVEPIAETPYKSFCQELTALSQKYGIVLQTVGGVNFGTEGFIGYDSDLDSGDLMPIYED